MKNKPIILFLIGIALGTGACFNSNRCVTITIDRIITELPESLGRIHSVWYDVRVHNHCKDTVRYRVRTDKEITRMIPMYGITAFISPDIYLIYRNDTIYDNFMVRERLSTNKEHIIAPNQSRSIVFVPNAWIVMELYETKYMEEFETEKDFWLDIVKHGVLHVVVDGKTHRVKNHGLFLEFNEED